MAEGKKFEIKPLGVFKVKDVPAGFEMQKLSEIEPIEQGSMVPTSREDLARLVEAPLLEACQIFFDKNIETWMSSANRKDIVQGEVHLIVHFDTLSPANKKIALQHGEHFKYLNRGYQKITMPVDMQTTSGQISKYMVKIANEFEDQS